MTFGTFGWKFTGPWFWKSLLAAALWSYGTVARAQTVVARGFLLDNSSNVDIADVLWGGGMLLRGPIAKSPVLLRISVDRAMGNTDRVRRPCHPMAPPICGPNAPSSRAALWIGGVGLSVPLVGDPRRTRASLSLVGDLHAGEQHLRLRDPNGTTASMYEILVGGAAGLSASWKLTVTSPVSVEVDAMIGGINRTPGSGDTGAYSAEGFSFRRYSLGLAWRR
jgi:hypothetical protein